MRHLQGRTGMRSTGLTCPCWSGFSRARPKRPPRAAPTAHCGASCGRLDFYGDSSGTTQFWRNRLLKVASNEDVRNSSLSFAVADSREYAKNGLIAAAGLEDSTADSASPQSFSPSKRTTTE